MVCIESQRVLHIPPRQNLITIHTISGAEPSKDPQAVASLSFPYQAWPRNHHSTFLCCNSFLSFLHHQLHLFLTGLEQQTHPVSVVVGREVCKPGPSVGIQALSVVVGREVCKPGPSVGIQAHLL